MTKLSINLNKIALLRNQRTVGYPSVLDAARTVIQAGAHGITMHPRPDERHIRGSDVLDAAELLKSYPEIEFNIEGNPFDGFMALCEQTRPHQATLVPDAPNANTSDDGWDVEKNADRLRPIIAQLKDWGCRVSLFMNAEPGAMAAAASVGADRIELYTGPWAEAFGQKEASQSLEQYRQAAEAALLVGLGINAGHDLTVENLPIFAATLPRLDEVSIGHAFTSDALWKGMAGSVHGFLEALDVEARRDALAGQTAGVPSKGSVAA